MSPPDTVPFVIVAAERTGSNLLIGLLESHPDIVIGGELFNPRSMRDGQMAWPLADDSRRDELRQLRDQDPIAFLDRIYEDAKAHGARATGFKLMYFHAEKSPVVLDRLVEDTHIHVVHLKRQNLFARFVSNEQARITDTWARSKDDKDYKAPVIDIDFRRMVHDIMYVESRQSDVDLGFERHPVLEVHYEDLAEDPERIAARVVEFLGLPPSPRFHIKYRKTGAKRLSEAVSNYDEIKQHLARWAGFLDS